MDMSFTELLGALGVTLVVVAVSFAVLCALISLVRFQLMTEKSRELEELGTGQEHDFRMVIMTQIAAARRAKRPITVMLLRLPESGATTAEAEAFVRPLVRGSDVIMVCGERLIGFLLMCGSDKSDTPTRRIAEQAIASSIPGASGWRFGVAGYPDHGYKTSEVYNRALTMIAEAESAGTLIAGMAAADAVADETSPTQGTIDPLTGLISEQHMIGIMRRYIARERKADNAVSLVYFDVDQFDRLLDQYGKGTTDEMLKELAAYLDQSIRETDIIARFGEAGMVVSMSAPPAAAAVAAQRILFAVRKAAFKAGNGMKVSLSAGVAGYPDVIGTVVQYFVAAEAALQNARLRGRNQCVKYDRTMQIHSEGEKELEHL